ncbi:MAG: permease [Candidatus Bipolaricaulota bacterium]|nr:permease [Candidatus Bipolaricaulota bacterium]
MNSTALVINGIAVGVLVFGVVKNREQTRKALKIALRSFIGMLPMILTVVILIGLLLGFVSREVIGKILGAESGILGVLVAAGLGSILHIPSLISFPLAASLLEGGAAVGTVAGFIASLTMIGAVTFPLEVREMGLRFTVMRNGLGFLFAVGIALVMGVLL